MNNQTRPIVVAALALMFSAAAHADMVLNWTFTYPDQMSGGNGTFTVRDWNDSQDGDFAQYLTDLQLFTGTEFPSDYARSDFLVVTAMSGYLPNTGVVSLLAKDVNNPILDPTKSLGAGFQGNDNVVLNPRDGNGRTVDGFFTPYGVSFSDSQGTLWNLFNPTKGVYQIANSLDYTDDPVPILDENGDQVLDENGDPATVIVRTYNPTDVTFTLGNSLPAPIPVPAAAWLMLSGLGGLFMAGRRRFSPANAG